MPGKESPAPEYESKGVIIPRAIEYKYVAFFFLEAKRVTRLAPHLDVLGFNFSVQPGPPAPHPPFYTMCGPLFCLTYGEHSVPAS